MAVSHLLPCLKPALFPQALWALNRPPLGLSMSSLLVPPWASLESSQGPPLGASQDLSGTSSGGLFPKANLGGLFITKALEICVKVIFS